jgi:hypothetical protein
MEQISRRLDLIRFGAQVNFRRFGLSSFFFILQRPSLGWVKPLAFRRLAIRWPAMRGLRRAAHTVYCLHTPN